jgi:hypothetical protein
MCSETQNPKVENNDIPYKHCLNCGSELNGMYCHNCGQQATSPNPPTKEFIMEYINNAFMWDSRFFHTLWQLIRHPGHLTNDFLAGKFVSQVHPLKFNMFMLFTFITLFLLFSDKDKINNSIDRFVNNEIVFPSIQLHSIKSNHEYYEKIKLCPRDTVQLLAPLSLATEYPEIISNIDTIEDREGESVDKWVAAIPHILIEDKFIIHEKSSGYYHFNKKKKTNASDIEILNMVWIQMVKLISKYFPMIILLTAPFLSLSLRLVQRKTKVPHIHNFIFSLHYIAFLEVLFIFIYVLYLIGIKHIIPLQFILMISSCTYLAIALRNVYKINSWYKAIAKSLFISCVYFIICLIIFIFIFFIACFLVAGELL